MKPLNPIATYIKIFIFDYQNQFSSAVAVISRLARRISLDVSRNALLFACLGVCNLNATMLVFEWTPRRVVLAADSLIIKATPLTATEVIGCKIYQASDVFFAFVGMTDDKTAGLDLVPIGKRTLRANGRLENKIESFNMQALATIKRLLEIESNLQPLKSLPGPKERSLDLVVTSAKDHILATRRYTRKTNGEIVVAPPVFYGNFFGQSRDTDYKAVGAIEDASTAMLSDSRLRGLQGTTFIDAVMQVQFRAEMDHKQRGQQTVRRVGPPVSVLQVEGGKASWVEDHQGKCPNVTAY